MEKLFELSVKGSLYFYLSVISEKQILQLKQFSSQFYKSNPVCQHQTDDEIMESFIAAVKQEFGIELESIPVTDVIVIK